MTNNLEKFDHLVVLMLENRSFDHMLGYLTLEEGRYDINGLTGNETNEWAGTQYPVHHLNTARFEWDPLHDARAVADQLADNNGGFVRNFYSAYGHKGVDPGMIMGYLNKNDLPVFHYLTQEYLVCDRWFCSLPGPTSPNRAYALSGTTFGQIENPKLWEFPAYRMPTIFDRLDLAGHDWRCYSHDVAWLRLYQQHFLDGVDFRERHIEKIQKFYTAAREGSLPALSWIEPNYEALGLGWTANDDHPSSDVRRGQELVLQVYEALVQSPLWEKILFIITYDEHGGFYDHVDPKEEVAADDYPHLRQYGLRVPAIVVSPYVQRGGVSSIVFDHTSIIKTVLLKFCSGEDGTVQDLMSLRVKEANHLGVLLEEDTPRIEGTQPETQEDLQETYALAMVEEQVVSWNLGAEAEPAIVQETPTDLQQMMRVLAEKAKDEGVPEERL